MNDDDRKAETQPMPQWRQDLLRQHAREQEEIDAIGAELAKGLEEQKKLEENSKKKKRPLPPYARHMTTAELNRRFCWYFLMRWEFYLALVAFVCFAAYFPWPWVADWGAVQAFVAVMAQIVPSIDGLPQAARHLPLAASKAQLSFIHFCGAIAFVYKLVTQGPTVWREVSKLRCVFSSICFAMVAAFFVHAIFFWAGNFNHGPEQGWHANRVQVAATHTAFWLFLTMTVSFAWSAIQEIIRQLRQP